MLTVPPSKRFITRPMADYPLSFRKDLDAWIRRQSRASIFDEDAPPKVLRPTSLRNIRANIRQFAHALVEEGVSLECLQSLTNLVETETYIVGLRHFVERNGNKPSSGLANLAGHLVAIAKYHAKVGPDHLEKLRAIKCRLVVENEGLTEKNKRRLQQFDDDRNVELLVALPALLLQKAVRSGKTSSRYALMVMHAVAIELLLACPMRVGNLANLDIGGIFAGMAPVVTKGWRLLSQAQRSRTVNPSKSTCRRKAWR